MANTKNLPIFVDLIYIPSYRGPCLFVSTSLYMYLLCCDIVKYSDETDILMHSSKLHPVSIQALKEKMDVHELKTKVLKLELSIRHEKVWQLFLILTEYDACTDKSNGLNPLRKLLI